MSSQPFGRRAKGTLSELYARSIVRRQTSYRQRSVNVGEIAERHIPGAGKFTPSDLKAISPKSCGVLSSMGPDIQWVHSYVTDDRIYCVYQSADEALVRRHAELGGFPVDWVDRVYSVIDPATAE